MTYEELLEMCVLTVVTPQKLASCEPFCCDNQDLDEFFANDSVIYSKRLLGNHIYCVFVTILILLWLHLPYPMIALGSPIN